MKCIAGLFLFLAFLVSLCSGADPACAASATDRARKLLIFHVGPDDRVAIEKNVKELPSLRNPEDPRQKFEVLEVWGYIYKAKYRMRLIYYNSPATKCLLMGEEILEHAKL